MSSAHRRQIAIATVGLGCLALVLNAWFSRGNVPRGKVAGSQPPLVGWIESSSAKALTKNATPPLPDLRNLAKDRKTPAEVRVQAIYHIAKQRDQESVDLLIQLLDDPLPLIRGRAAGAIETILGANFNFRAEDNKSQRREVVLGIRRYWSTRKSPAPNATTSMAH